MAHTRLRLAIHNRRQRLVSKGLCLIHSNARLHVAAATREMMDSFGWEVFDHTPCGPDLLPSEYHLYPRLKEVLGNVNLDSDKELNPTGG